MAHNVKCMYCGKTFDRDKVECVQVSARRYAEKTCAEAHENSKTKEQKDLETLEEYIMKLFNTTYITARVRKQINQMKDVNNFSYSGMLKSLIYFYEIKGNSLEKANGGIGIVPFVYEDAYNYYYSLFVAQQKNEHKDLDSFIYETREITISSPQRKPRKRQKFSFLDDEDALGGGRK